MSDTRKDRLTTREVAERWGCHPDTVFRRLRSRGAESTQWGKARMWRRVDVEAFEVDADMAGQVG